MRAPRKRLARILFVCAAAAVVLGIGARFVVHDLTDGGRRPAAELERGLSPQARAVLDEITRDLDPARIFDYHAHIAGLGAGGSGCSVNPKMRSIWHPWLKLQFAMYTRAAGVSDLDRGDEQFVERLVELVRAMPVHGRHGLLALDHRYAKDGEADLEHTALFVPNDYVCRLASEHPDLFAPVISVHPYRKDALAELDLFGARGVRLVKWLPNSMEIDPADPRCDAFYDRMARWNMALLTHSGDEHAVDSTGSQALGNPLRLRRPLDRGVKVIVAHCASLGQGDDLDHPGETAHNFDLFLRLMDEPRYAGRVFGEISALSQINRSSRPIATLLERSDLHPRLVNGSDYPLPAINVLFSTRLLAWKDLLSSDDCAALDEIRRYNPLLFDLALKRRLRHPVSGARFPPSVFMAHPALSPDP